MKKGYTYTIFFMLIVSVVYTALLAFANLLAADKINENTAFALQRNVLYVFDIANDNTVSGVADVYKKNVKNLSLKSASGSGEETVPAKVDDAGNVTAYAIPIKGPGLWGTIEGYLGVGVDLKKLTGIVFTKQSETPGLGARIDEEEYKSQYRGMPVSAGQVLKLKSSTDGEVDAITGATFTSRSVVSMINKALENDLSRLEGLK